MRNLQKPLAIFLNSHCPVATLLSSVPYWNMDSSSWLLIHQGCAAIMLGGSLKKPNIHSVHLLQRMDCFHIFVRDQPPRIFPFTHLHCKFPPHHPYVSLDRPRCRLIPFRDDRPRYLVESQICQERRISPGHETVAILSKKTSPAMLRA